MRIIEEPKLDFCDVMICPKRSTLRSRKEIDLVREYTFRNSGKKFSGIPIIASNMDTVGTIEMARALAIHQLQTCLHKFHPFTELQLLFNQAEDGFAERCYFTCGATDEDLKSLQTINTLLTIENICIDVANGYQEAFVDFVKKVRELLPYGVVMAGNVATAEMTEELILAGADIVKVGIGSGSACYTRKVTGVGYPQLSAIIECADAAHGLGGHICSDGGCKNPGDIAKAFGAGADFVMLGGMLAGHKECGGTPMFKGQNQVWTTALGDDPNSDVELEFYGMSSHVAQHKYYGGVANHRASEGKYVRVPYRGKVENTILEILGGLRSACTYVGALRLKELSKRTTFIKVSRQLNDMFKD